MWLEEFGKKPDATYSYRDGESGNNLSPCFKPVGIDSCLSTLAAGPLVMLIMYRGSVAKLIHFVPSCIVAAPSISCSFVMGRVAVSDLVSSDGSG